MDNTKEYILMCEKAEEIQTLFQKPIGLNGAPTDAEGIVIGIRNLDVIGDTWLPRQDQLQEMIEDKGWFLSLLKYFTAWAGNEYTLKDKQFQLDSMEQLWLAFIMEEKYNKKWNGKDWVLDG